jgi:hypothetical protein
MDHLPSYPNAAEDHAESMGAEERTWRPRTRSRCGGVPRPGVGFGPESGPALAMTHGQRARRQPVAAVCQGTPRPMTGPNPPLIWASPPAE